MTSPKPPSPKIPSIIPKVTPSIPTRRDIPILKTTEVSVKPAVKERVYPITDLLKKHYDEFKFLIRLRHKDTGKLVGYYGLVDDIPSRHTAIEEIYDIKGISVEKLYEKWANDAAIWLQHHDIEEFEIQSSIFITD